MALSPPTGEVAEMDIPILKQGDCLICSLKKEFSDADMNEFRDELLEKVGEFRSRGVIVDVTALLVMDSFTTRMLHDITRSVQLRGAKAVIVGIQPAVAFPMVQLGVTLKGVTTALDLEEGLAHLNGN